MNILCAASAAFLLGKSSLVCSLVPSVHVVRCITNACWLQLASCNSARCARSPPRNRFKASFEAPLPPLARHNNNAEIANQLQYWFNHEG